jgi:hypothetical protein
MSVGGVGRIGEGKSSFYTHWGGLECRVLKPFKAGPSCKAHRREAHYV